MEAIKVFIAGGTGAIGSALIDQYQQWSRSTGRPLELYATGRRRPTHLEPATTWLPVDFRDSDSIAEVGKQLANKTTTLDHWICCTGYLHGEFGLPEKALKSVQGDKLAGDFAVNTVGPLLLFQECVGLLKKARLAKAVFLSAQVGSIEDNSSGGWYGYRMSKAALNMGVRCAAIECARWRQPPAIVALHPGTTISDLSQPFTVRRKAAPQTAEQCAAQLFSRIHALEAKDSGTFQRLDGSVLPW